MKTLFILLLMLAWPGLSQASVTGQLKSSSDYYPQHLGEPTDDLVPYLSLDLKGKNKLSPKLRWQWRAYAIGNPEAKSQPEQFFGDLPEAFFEYKLEDWRWRLGMNTLNWGVVDVSSPSNVVNPQVLFHPLRSFKRGSPMLEMEWKKDWLNAHLVYIPYQMRSVLPSVDSRWLPRTFIVNTLFEGHKVILPPFLEYEYGEPREYDNALMHNAGLRLSSHVGSWDFYLMHFEGSAPSPKVSTTITTIANAVQSPIVLHIDSYRVRTSSLAAVWAGERWIFRGESAYQSSITQESNIQGWSWSNVLAAETNVEIGTTTMTILGQYYYTVNPLDPDNLISSSYRLFDRTGMIGARYAPSEEWLFNLSALYEGTGQGVFWMASFEQKMNDALRWGLGWRDFSASADGLIKTFERNDHATLDLIYYF